ncbi:MAG: hypothetical protein Ct9H300mP16_10240 [Pseudomonadota bacterium]|nr:MAG: hypothetical protein Ct9H300mP16_10240 [Pseudomonadota bacterium]
MENNKGFIVLVDISGYTRFVRSHRVRKIPILGKQLASTNEEHAETIISDPLEKIFGKSWTTRSLSTSCKATLPCFMPYRMILRISLRR